MDSGDNKAGPVGSRAKPSWLLFAIPALALGTGLLSACGPLSPPPVPADESRLEPLRIQYTDVTRSSGIQFAHNSGAYGKKYLPETMGSGVVFLDYDGGGGEDIFFINGTDWPEHHRQATFPALYRNLGDGTFQDVTEEAGLAIEAYGMGAAAADFDADGHTDLFLNAVGEDHLFRNRGDGTFEDVTRRAGVSDPAFGSSATWIDYDRDGWLDLFVGNYVQWSPGTDIFCTLDGEAKSYCTPESYPGATNRLFRNRGDGTFEDVTRRAGVFDPTGKSLGVVMLDYDGDGWPDLAVANDTVPNFLYHNLRDGSFEEVGVQAGIGLGEDGKARGAMGIDAGDYDGSGRESLLIGNFANEMLALYQNLSPGLFIDEAPVAGIGVPSLLTLAFGCFFFDFDLDGRLDLFVANGHVENDINRIQPTVTYSQSPHLFRGIGAGQFDLVTEKVGTDLARPMVGRGAAFADIDGDGDLDIAVTGNNSPAVLLRNDGGNSSGWIRIRLAGLPPNRDAIGARVYLRSDRLQTMRMVRSSSSYASQSEATLTFGLGPAGKEGSLKLDAEVVWPDGTRQLFPGLESNQVHVLSQAKEKS